MLQIQTKISIEINFYYYIIYKQYAFNDYQYDNNF